MGPDASGTKLTQHSTFRTSYQQSNMVVVVWWCGDTLLILDLGDLTLMELWILFSTSNSWRRISGHQSMIWRSSAVRLCSKTAVWQSPDLNSIDMLWQDLKQAVLAWKPAEKKWAKIPPEQCGRLISSYQMHLVAVVPAKGGILSYIWGGRHFFT